MEKLTEHFSQFELTCGCGCGTFILNKNLLTRLEVARVHAGVPFVLNSATRCPKHNIKSGGVDGSSHLVGKAVDIRVRDSNERFKITEALFSAGFNRITVKKTFIHVDVDQDKSPEVMWV